MRIYWWQGGVHLDPESDREREALTLLWRSVPLISDVRAIQLTSSGDVAATFSVPAETDERTEFALVARGACEDLGLDYDPSLHLADQLRAILKTMDGATERILR